MSMAFRRLLCLALLAVVLAGVGCGTERGGRAAPDASAPASPTPSALPTALPDPGLGAHLGLRLEERTLPDRRRYYLGVPTCTGSAGCQIWLDHPRKLIIWLHGATQVEDTANAAYPIRTLWNLTGGEAVIVFGVSANGTRLWDADLCCTLRKVDEVGYVEDVIADVDTVTPVNPGRVGLIGVSNGGMLATKVVCERPDLIKAIGIWAASWQGRCDRGPVTIGHWHGTDDPLIPIGGGTTALLGRRVTFPPADWLAGRLAAGSTFLYVAVPGAGHGPAPAATSTALLDWLDAQL